MQSSQAPLLHTQYILLNMKSDIVRGSKVGTIDLGPSVRYSRTTTLESFRQVG